MVTGFIGSDMQGEITTLGRGGSDYSAAIIGDGINADEVWIWTDVDGIMTTDPAIIPTSRLIPEISFQEVYDLAFFGAQVLHPKTILPALEKNIPVRIKNTFNKDNPGTFIFPLDQDCHSQVKAITGLQQVGLLTINGSDYQIVTKLIKSVKNLLGKPEIKVLGVFNDKNINSTYIVINRNPTLEQLDALNELSASQQSTNIFSGIQITADQSLITAVGPRISDNTTIARKLTDQLQQAGVKFSAPISSDSHHSLSFLIPKKDHLKAIQHIHNELIYCPASNTSTAD